MNFIFINPDEMRAESIGCYGHPLVRTPNIDRLAEQGTRFDQCHAQHTVCSPSRCSFMTGWYPHVRGHRTLWHLLQPDEPNMLKYFKQAGYETIWIGKNDTLAQTAFRDSVDHVYQPRGISYGKNPYPADDARHYSFLHEPYDGVLEKEGDYAHFQRAIEYLQGGPQRPFCMTLNTFMPHCPYSCPNPWHDMYDPDDIPPLREKDLPDRPSHQALIRRYRRLDEAGWDHLRKINAVYLGMISYVDHLLGRLLQTLEETGLAQNTTVVLFSDHGDYAGDYGLVEKWSSGLEDVLTRVPLIIRTPGGVGNHVINEPVELFDIFATAMDIAGITPRHTHFAHSLVPQLRGEAGASDRTVFANGGYGQHELHCHEGWSSAPELRDPRNMYYPKSKQQLDHPESIERCAMIRTSTHKLIHRPVGLSELYDLREDPKELNNLIHNSAYHTIRDRLAQYLLDWYVRTSDIVPFKTDLRGHPPDIVNK